MTTIGGVAFRYLDRLPHVGDQVTVEGIQITILEMDMHRIARVRVARRVSAEELSEPQAEEEELTEDASANPKDDAEVNEVVDHDAKSQALKGPENH